MRLRLSLLMFLNYAAQGAFCPLFTLRLQQELDFGPLEIGLICATQALAGLSTPFAAGQLADRYFPAQRCLAAFALSAGVFLWLLPALTSPLTVFAMTLAVWLTMGPASTLCAALCFAHLSRPERDFGFARMCGTLGWVAAGWLVGGWLWLRGAGALADIFRWSGLLSCALGVYALTLPHTPPHRHGGGLAPLTALRHLRGRPFLVYWACSFGLCLTLPFTVQMIPMLLEQHGIPRQWVSPTLTLGQSMEIVALGMLPVLLL
ncbi:MAG TPA: MFS transporter, partial [Pirellulales bacterium]